ncbi:MAG: hypothetical protein HY518_03425 [Candidatus Aenigmarchaeota archaeon]|nr:hypothetical protein [Candidatus Aenigmarchaeota archaeon]
MTNIYELFKMIFGIIASIFILYFLITYTAGYKDTQLASVRQSIVKSFITASENVYFSGIPFRFDEFRSQEFSYSLSTAASQPQVEFGSGKAPVRVPLFFIEGEELAMARNEVDLGWWKFYYVLAVPAVDIVFNLQDSSGESADAARDIASLFPDSDSPAVRMGLCSGPRVDMYTKDQFARLDRGALSSAPPCTASIGQDARLVIISSTCNPSQTARGVCVHPSAKLAYINGLSSAYNYKDSLDILALIIGGEGKDVFGSVKGGQLFEYKNSMMRKELLLAAKMMRIRAEILSSELEECNYFPLASGLEDLAGILADDDYYQKRASIQEYLSANDRISLGWDELVKAGCEK